MESNAPGPDVTLESSDGTKYSLPYSAAKLSNTVKDAQGDLDDDEEMEEPREVKIPKVASRCLEKVVAFLKHYREEPMDVIKTPLEENEFSKVIKQEWYRDFATGVDQPMLFELLTAANYMAIQPLLDLTCLQVSCQLMGKSAEEIRTVLNIPRLSPEEDIAARQQHRWIFDD